MRSIISPVRSCSKRIFGEEIDHLLAELDQLVVVLVGLQLHERHDHGAHQVADLQRALAADQEA